MVFNIFYPIKTHYQQLCNYLKAFMGKTSNLSSEVNEYMNSFNIILADKDLETFKKFQCLNNKFNFINLSSDFAVSFMMEHEKVDLIIISKRIPNLSSIVERANKKKINVYILGEDIKFPIAEGEIEGMLLKEVERKVLDRKNGRFNFKRYINHFLNLDGTGKLIPPPDCRLHKEVRSCPIKGDDKRNLKCEKELAGKVVNKSNLSGEIDRRGFKNKIGDSGSSQENTFVKLEDGVNLAQDNDFEIKRIRTIKQKIIILSKAKGGVGSTTISIFLGHIFYKVKTLLVDLNFSEGGGDMSYYLDIPRSPNILNFIDGYSRDSLESSVVKIKENLDILQTPPTYEMSKKVDLQDIYCLADIAKKKYHLIIFDLPNKFDDLLLGVVDLADLLIMVSDHTLGSIGRLLKMNNRFIYDDLEKILIINKYNKANGLNLFKNRIEQFFNLKDFVFLDESEVLREKSEFSDFNFSNLKSFNCLTEKVFSLLTCD